MSKLLKLIAVGAVILYWPSGTMSMTFFNCKNITEKSGIVRFDSDNETTTIAGNYMIFWDRSFRNDFKPDYLKNLQWMGAPGTSVTTR